MSKKLFIGLVPLLVTAAFAVTPAVSQATTCSAGAAKCHWFQNSKPPGAAITAGTPVSIISWGTLTLTSGAGTVSCKNTVIGTNENPVGGGNGIDETDNFATANCVAAGCEAAAGQEAIVTPEQLPWGAELEESLRAGKFVVRNNTKAFAPGTVALDGTHFLSTVGAQVTVRCTFRPGYAAPTVAAIVEGGCLLKGGTNPTCKELGEAEGAAFEKGELERQEVGVPGLGNGYTGYPESEPGRPPIINIPNFGPGSPTEKAFISQCNESSTGYKGAGTPDQSPSLTPGSGIGSKPSKVEFDSATGVLNCKEFGEGITGGTLKSMGYNEQEIIAAY